jgi:hypothetical protein
MLTEAHRSCRHEDDRDEGEWRTTGWEIPGVPRVPSRPYLPFHDGILGEPTENLAIYYWS